MGRQARRFFGVGSLSPGLATNTERPGFLRSGRVFIDTRGSTDCKTIVESLVHEFRETYLLLSGRERNARAAHHAVIGWDSRESDAICKNCCPLLGPS